MKDMKKEIKEHTDKSCSTCGRICRIPSLLTERRLLGPDTVWYCCNYTPRSLKIETVTLYRYTYRYDDGRIGQTFWGNEDFVPNGSTLLKTEEKEIYT